MDAVPEQVGVVLLQRAGAVGGAAQHLAHLAQVRVQVGHRVVQVAGSHSDLGGRGVDVVLDSVGGKNLVDSIDALAYRGTLVSVGVAGRGGSGVEAGSLWTKNNALRGVYLGGALLSEYPRVHRMISDLLDRVASGELHVEIDRSFPLAQAADAHEYLEGRNAFGRVVMTP